jgi:hypothetical protein
VEIIRAWKGNMKRLTFVIVILMSLSVLAAAQSCLVVRQAEGHRFRNSMIAGVLTGGIGFAGGLAFSGAKFEYVDAYNVSNPKMKYKGSELQKLQSSGVHVIIVEKAKKGISTADEVKDARDSCKSIAATPPPQPTTTAPATTAPATTQQSASPNVTTTPLQPPQKQEESLGDAARRYRQQKQQ